MLNTYLKIAFRTVLNNKLYTAIKVLGLAIGVSACLAIFQTVTYERSFDQFHAEADRIYRIYTQFDEIGEDVFEGISFPMIATVESQQVTEIEASAPLHMLYTSRVRLGASEKNFNDLKTVTFTTSGFFELFSSYKWLSGSPDAALASPNQVVLVESQAHRYFELDDIAKAIGRTLIYQDSLIVTVSGVVADLEQTSDLYFTDFISYSTIENSWYKKEVSTTEWSNFYSNTQMFIKKQAQVASTTITKQLNDIYNQNVPPSEDDGDITTFHLQPLADFHSDMKLSKFLHSSAALSPSTLRVLIGIAALLLLIAGINFINLTTAQSFQRNKEVGVRKVLGSNRATLIRQFLSETFLLTSMAVVLSVFITYMGMLYFIEFLPEGIHFQWLTPNVLLFLLLVLLLVGLLAGIYPAFVLSAARPVTALKSTNNKFSTKSSGEWIRKSLIVVQFSMAALLITITLIFGQQINYLLNKDLGINQEAIVNFYTSWRYPLEKQALLKEELLRLPEVSLLSKHSMPATSKDYMTSMFEFEADGTTQRTDISRQTIDENYLDLYGIELLTGRQPLSNESSKEILINESMLTLLELQNPEEAIGKTLRKGENLYPIVGVVKNFHHRELQLKIEPLIMSMGKRSFCFSLKMDTPNMSASLKKVAQIWQTIYPNTTFKPTFFDESIAKFYESEQRAATLLRFATFIAISISCIGLLGLAAFSVARRTREIGIRKVLGATVTHIVALLSKDFLLLVLIAVLLATPVAWYFAQKWLSQFAYHIELQWWIFLSAGLIAVGIALLTVSFQSIKAALANPVKSLRNE